MPSTVSMFESALRYHEKGQLDKAECAYRKLLDRTPRHAEALHGLGLLAHQRGDHPRAAALIGKAIGIRPGAQRFHITLGRVLIAGGAIDDAARCLTRAIQMQPCSAEAYNVLGRLLHDAGDFENAGACYVRAARVHPGLCQPYCNLGNLFLEGGRPAPAMEYLRRALHIHPACAEAHLNLGIALLDRLDFEGAVSQFRRACRLRPNDAKLHGYWSHALLQRGFLAEGWAQNEWGLRLRTRVVSDISAPFWDGSPLDGLTALVLAEQGVGDQIMFMSCVPDFLREARPAVCIVECDPRLVPLYRRSFPGLQFLSRQPDARRSADQRGGDVKVAIGSLPGVFRRCHGDFPRATGYLVADRERVSHWEDRYRCLGTGRVIGISWRGGHQPQQRRRRSTKLAQWMQVLSAPDAVFVDLQYGDCRQELRAANSGGKTLVHHWPDADPLLDLDDFAARIAALDLVISVDNCTVHMAGALGVPVWTLLPFAADWRWMRDRSDTPWYPGMRLFRQPRPGDWNAVFAQVARLLAA